MTRTIRRLHQGFWFSLLLIAGCDSNSPTSPSNESISLRSIVPAEGTTLRAGDRVTINAVATFTIVNANGGTASMFILDERNVTLLPEGETPPQAALTQGKTTVT